MLSFIALFHFWSSVLLIFCRRIYRNILKYILSCIYNSMNFYKFWHMITRYSIWNSFWYNWLAHRLYKLIGERPNNRIHCHIIYKRSANFKWVDKFTVIHIQCTEILWIWSLRFIQIWYFWILIFNWIWSFWTLELDYFSR